MIISKERAVLLNNIRTAPQIATTLFKSRVVFLWRVKNTLYLIAAPGI